MRRKSEKMDIQRGVALERVGAIDSKPGTFRRGFAVRKKDHSLPNGRRDGRTIWRRERLINPRWILLFLCCAMLFGARPIACQEQSRRRNSVETDFEWEEAEEDQQCEMVVKCKKSALKTTPSPSSASSSKKSSSVSPETSTYRVPLKPFGAPFNPMAEGGSVMWQKMGATPRNSAKGGGGGGGGGKKTKSATTTRGDKFEKDFKAKKANSLLGRKKSHKLHKGKGESRC